MGFLERMGLIEKEELQTAAYSAMVEDSAEIVEANAAIESETDIVENIYSQNDMSDRTDSIYTIQALIGTLPGEMTTAKKQSTIAGILAVSGKSIQSLIDDAVFRVKVLSAARDKVIEERTTEIAQTNQDIEGLKTLIEEATIRIHKAESIIEATTKSVNDEIAIITELNDFAEGMKKEDKS